VRVSQAAALALISYGVLVLLAPHMLPTMLGAAFD
jgi:hypothetical protein